MSFKVGTLVESHLIHDLSADYTPSHIIFSISQVPDFLPDHAESLGRHAGNRINRYARHRRGSTRRRIKAAN